MFFSETARLKLLPWLAATIAIGVLPLGLTTAAQAQTVIYNGRTIVTEDYDRYDDDDDRYERYERYDHYDRYDNDSRYDRYDNYGRYDNRYDRRYGRYEHYDHDDHYDRDDYYDYDDYYDGYYHRDTNRRRPHITIIQQRPSQRHSNPACLAFGNLRVACRR